MNYPVWDVPYLGAGLVVAIIAIVHVLISHIAVGGGAFLLMSELWSNRQPDGVRIRAWLHRYATFFIVFTTVVGAMTGVGIWFSIQLANPEATSLLIHQYVFAWATEWVAFIGELTVVYLYYYGWSTNSRRVQIFLAGAYFVIAWISLVIINGILTFMMTPGGWTLENHSVAAGFFNQGYFPSLLLRTVLMFLVAGLSSLVVAARTPDQNLKERIVRYAVKWIVPAAVLAPLFTIWYWTKLPAATVKLVEAGVVGLAGGRLEVMSRAIWLAVMVGALLVVGTLVVALKPRALATGSAVALLLTALLGVAGAEFFREMGRKPFVIRDVLYANNLWKKDAVEATLRQPFLSRAKWHPETDPDTVEHGAWVFRLQCGTCHTRDGYRAMNQRTASWTTSFGYRWFLTMDQQGVMPPFQGNDADRAALTAYILSFQGKNVTPAQVMADVVADEAKNKTASTAPTPSAAPVAPVAPAAPAVPVAPAVEVKL